jgi:hypothetical protein
MRRPLYAKAGQCCFYVLTGACEVLDPGIERRAPPCVVGVGESRRMGQEAVEVIEHEQQQSRSRGAHWILSFGGSGHFRKGLAWFGVYLRGHGCSSNRLSAASRKFRAL